jgi:hypothetical protein
MLFCISSIIPEESRQHNNIINLFHQKVNHYEKFYKTNHKHVTRQLIVNNTNKAIQLRIALKKKAFSK